MAITAGVAHTAQFFINQTDLLAPNGVDIVWPADGFLTDMQVVVNATVTTGGTLAARINNVAVDGLVATVANAAAKGTVVSKAATKGHASRLVKKGDRVTVLPASFATAGAVNGYIRSQALVGGEAALP